MAEGKVSYIKLSCFIKILDYFSAAAKEGKIDVQQDDYDMIQEALKYARGYQRLGTAALSIFVLGVLAFVTTLLIKYGYDYALGLEIARYTNPTAVVASGTSLWLLLKAYEKRKAVINIASRYNRNDRLQMFR